MARTRDPSRQAPFAELPKAHPWIWWSGFLIISSVIIVLILLSNRLIPAAPAKVSATVTWTVVQLGLIVITILLALYALYRARLEWNALNGLRVDVQDFADARPAGTGTSIKELTAGFKSKLNTSRIYRPAAIPGTAGSQDFLQIVENAGEAAPGGWWKVAARLLRLLRQPAAYRVSGTVVDSQKSGIYKLVVELVRLPRTAANPLVLEDDHWERLLERAANSVAAQIFPRSKMCKRQPQWVEWWGYHFPPELFDAYQQAHKYQDDREYDRALWEFYRALKLDPSNVYIRLEIAQLQERLDLHLDALVTYDDVITICSRDDPSLAEWWNATDPDQEWPGPRRHRRLALLIARNRHALMLGLGDRIAQQWWQHPETHEAPYNERQLQRDYLRAIIGLRFARYRLPQTWWPAGERGWRSVGAVLSTEASVDRDGDERRALATALGAYLCTLAQYEFERLSFDYPRYRRNWRFARHTRGLADLVSTRGLRLCLVWAMLRRAMAFAVAKEPIDPAGPIWPKTPWLPRADTLFPPASWPPDPTLSRVIASLGRGTMVWHEHYNLACVCSVPLLRPTGLPDDDAETLRRLAVSHLYRAAAASHSGFLAQRRTWLLHEDPDLARLRGTPEFRNFELITFARHKMASLRPSEVHRWELACYQAKLISCLAEAMAERWRRRGLSPSTESGAERQAMVRAEKDGWRHVARLAISHRDWRVRYDAIVPLLRWRKESGLPFADIGLPEYSLHDLHVRHANAVAPCPSDGDTDINDLVTAYLDRCGERMRHLANELGLTGAAANGVCELDLTGSLPISRLDRSASPAECRWRAELWTALKTLFDDQSGGDSYEARLAAFQKARCRPRGWLARC